CRGALLRWAAAGLLRRRRQRQRREYQRNQYDRSLCPGHARVSPAFDRAPIPSPRSHRAPESDATDIDRLWQAGDITMKSEAFWATISSGQAVANIMGIMRVIGIAGWSGAGKTTLLAKLIPCLTGRGLRVSTVKHAHHAFDVDQPGKDSHTHRMAGATEVLVSSANRWALVHELRGSPDPPLPKFLATLP